MQKTRLKDNIATAADFQKLIIIHFKQYRKNKDPEEQGDRAEKRNQHCKRNEVSRSLERISIEHLQVGLDYNSISDVVK